MYRLKICLFLPLFWLTVAPTYGQSPKEEFIAFCKSKHVPLAKKFESVEFFELRTESSRTSWRSITLDHGCLLEFIWPNSGIGGKSKTGKRALLTNIAISNHDYFAYLAANESTRTESSPQNPLGVSWQIQMLNEAATTNDCLLQYCYMLPRSGMTYHELASNDETTITSWEVDREAKTGTLKLRSSVVPKVSGEANVTAVFDLESGACFEMAITGKAPAGFKEKLATINHMIEYSELSPVPIVKEIVITPNFAASTKSEVKFVNFQPEVVKTTFRLPFYGISEPKFQTKTTLADWWVWIAVATIALSAFFYVAYRKNS